MKEVNYILLFDKDLLTSSILTISIYKEQPTSHVYKAFSTPEALKLLDMVCGHEDNFSYPQEVCFIVDLNMGAVEGYVFLSFLEQYNSSYPIRVYVLNDEDMPKSGLPSIEHQQIAGKFNKSQSSEIIDCIKNDPSPRYFKDKRTMEEAHLW